MKKYVQKRYIFKVKKTTKDIFFFLRGVGNFEKENTSFKYKRSPEVFSQIKMFDLKSYKKAIPTT